MTYKNIMFEMFESATAELRKGYLYSANLLMWACYELLWKAGKVDKTGHFDWEIGLCFHNFSDSQLEQALRELQTEQKLPATLNSIEDFKSKLNRKLKKECPITLKKIKETFEQCYDIYIDSKHGVTADFSKKGLNAKLESSLDLETVQALHHMLSCYIDTMYMKDVIEKYGLEYMDKKYGSPKN